MTCLYTRSERRHDEAQPRSATVRLLMRHVAPVLRNRPLMAAAVRLVIVPRVDDQQDRAHRAPFQRPAQVRHQRRRPGGTSRRCPGAVHRIRACPLPPRVSTSSMASDGNLQKEVAVMSSAGSRRWWALGAVFLTILCVGVDSTVLSVAPPDAGQVAARVGDRSAVVLFGLLPGPGRCDAPGWPAG